MISLSNDDVYNELLERLDIAIIQLNELKVNRILRLDTAFYDKIAIAYDKKIKSHKHYFIPETQVVSGPFGSSLKSTAYLNSGIPFIRIEDIKGGFTVNRSQMVYISIDDNNRLKNSQLLVDDLVLSKVGNSIGFYARIDQELGLCNISENNIGIKLREFPTERKHFILVYLNSKIGNILTLRRKSGNAQPKLNVFDIAEIPIPYVSTDFEKLISRTVTKSHDLQTAAILKYKEAELNLLQNLGLNTRQPSREQLSLRLFKDITDAGRIDAEYYQPKYDEIKARLQKTSDGTVATECILFDKNFHPEKAVEYKYIELANIGTLGEITGCTVGTGTELPSRARRIVHSGDIIISSIEGSLQSCALITDEYDGALCSTGFYVLRSENINSETLLTLFKSEPVQALLKQQCSGTILTAFGKDGLLSIPIPQIQEDLQHMIKKSITESFDLRQQSIQLLNASKHAVEIAIKRSEAAAIEYLNNTI